MSEPDLDSLFSTDLDNAEARMRRSLQLAGRPQGADGHAPKQDRFSDRNGPRPRQRFVQDGDVPVTVVNRRQQDGRLALPGNEGALAMEQAARLKAERALQEAQAMIHDLQTKAGHAELARREAVAGQESQLVTELAAERAARIAAEAALQDLLAARAQPTPPTVEPVRMPRKPAVKAAIRAVREPKPVKWWLSSAKRS